MHREDFPQPFHIALIVAGLIAAAAIVLAVLAPPIDSAPLRFASLDLSDRYCEFTVTPTADLQSPAAPPGPVYAADVLDVPAQRSRHPLPPPDRAGEPSMASAVAPGMQPPLDVGIHRALGSRLVAQPVADGASPLADPETFAALDEAGFESASQRPLSTFAIDVDTASYTVARRFIQRIGRLPPRGAVRVEEFVNYFAYDYPEPQGQHPFAVVTEVSTAPWNPDNRLVHIGLQGRRVDAGHLPRQNLVFLVDVSGSMRGRDRLPLVRRSLALLVDHLRPDDRVAIVVYAGAAGLVLPSTPVARRGRILAALDRLSAGGSTAGGAGIELAYDTAAIGFASGGNNRVILATDGDFNVGPSSESALVALIEEKRETGVFLTVLGFGAGNYRDAKMELLSNAGNGTAAYIDSLREARKVLVQEMTGTLQTIAKDVKVQVEFNPARVAEYRLIGYENRALADRDFADDTKDAGELGAGHTVTVLYEVVPAAPEGEAAPELLNVRLRYKQPDGARSTRIDHPLVDAHVDLAAASDDFRFAAAVAGFAQRLRGSAHLRGSTFDDIAGLAFGALGADPHGHRVQFVELVRRAGALARPHAAR